jgi:hypothetical protein
MRNLKLTLCLSAALATAAAYAQVLSPDVNGDAPAATSSSPVAYVYVASTPVIVWVTQGTGTFTTTASAYQTTDGVIHAVVDGSVPINDSPVFILE